MSGGTAVTEVYVWLWGVWVVNKDVEQAALAFGESLKQVGNLAPLSG